MMKDLIEELRECIQRNDRAPGSILTLMVKAGHTLGEQAREIERLRLNIAEYNEHERCYQAEIAALNQPSAGVDERAAFEAACESLGLALYAGSDCRYAKEIQCAWMLWQARAQLAAPAGVPDGWRLVPVEPSVQMERAGTQKSPGFITLRDACDIYKAMLAAAPSPAPASDVVQVPRELPPFAQKVISKMERFEECASDGQDVDIGRHWLDLLTQLGLLNRVQRSPGLWEISQQGEALLNGGRV